MTADRQTIFANGRPELLHEHMQVMQNEGQKKRKVKEKVKRHEKKDEQVQVRIHDDERAIEKKLGLDNKQT